MCLRSSGNIWTLSPAAYSFLPLPYLCFPVPGPNTSQSKHSSPLYTSPHNSKVTRPSRTAPRPKLCNPHPAATVQYVTYGLCASPRRTVALKWVHCSTLFGRWSWHCSENVMPLFWEATRTPSSYNCTPPISSMVQLSWLLPFPTTEYIRMYRQSYPFTRKAGVVRTLLWWWIGIGCRCAINSPRLSIRPSPLLCIRSVVRILPATMLAASFYWSLCICSGGHFPLSYRFFFEVILDFYL